VALADALLCEPPLLLLDEPTAGLDPNQVSEVRSLLGELGKERAVLLSTHVLSEVEATCERALVIHRGRLVAAGSLAELSAQARGQRAEILVRGDLEAARTALSQAGLRVGGDSSEGDGHRLKVDAGSTSAGDVTGTIERAVAALVGAGLHVRGAQPERAALDEVFRALTHAAGVGHPISAHPSLGPPSLGDGPPDAREGTLP
jgi:ABC-2 type transport system ATP-binding protein